MVEEIRNMWCDALEELLQCPVCLDTAQSVKVQCINGHHICNPCRIQLQICPICKSYFISTRNLVVEQLSAKLHDIKLSLLHPYHALNRRILPDKVCKATQTETVCMPSTSSACQTEPVNQATTVTVRNEQQRLMVNLAPRIGKGLYPCRIGSCIAKLPHGRIIGHLRYCHKDVFYEFSTGNKLTIFKKNWSLEYILDRDYNFAFHIKEMGLFFLNITINHIGDLIAFVQIVNCVDVSKQFVHTFEVIGTVNATYSGPVKSCRVECMSNDCLHVLQKNMRHNIVDNKNIFHCNLTIKRRVDYSHDSPRDRLLTLSQNNEMQYEDIHD